MLCDTGFDEQDARILATSYDANAQTAFVTFDSNNYELASIWQLDESNTTKDDQTVTFTIAPASLANSQIIVLEDTATLVNGKAEPAVKVLPLSAFKTDQAQYRQCKQCHDLCLNDDSIFRV